MHRPDPSQIVLPAQVIQPVAIHSQQFRGIRLHVLGLLDGLLHPAPLKCFHLFIQLDPRRGQLAT